MTDDRLQDLHLQTIARDIERQHARDEKMRPIDAEDVLTTLNNRIRAFEAALPPKTQLAIQLASGHSLNVKFVEAHGRAVVEIKGQDNEGQPRSLVMHFSQFCIDMRAVPLHEGEARKPIGFK